MGLKLNATNGGGSVELDVPDTVNSDVVLTLPTGIGTAGQYLKNSATPGTLEFGTLPTVGFTSSAKVTTTSGSSHTVTGLDTNATFHLIAVEGISMAGSASPQLLMQIGNGSLSTANYNWTTAHNSAADSASNSSSIRLSQVGFVSNANVYNGVIQIVCDSGDAVVGNWVIGVEQSLVAYGGFSWTGGTSIDRISLQTSDTFDAGSFKIHSR